MGNRILIVDDNLNNLRLLKEILEDENYEVYAESDGSKVIELVHSVNPKIILLDIMMPQIDGFKVCELLKGDPKTSSIPIIMVTAKVEGADIKKAMEAGAFDYIKKPIDEAEVIARVQSALRYYEKLCVLEHMATRDSLTGSYNHALLLDMLAREMSRGKRVDKNVAFIMMDIDFFKKINDNYGHISGDIILKNIVKLILTCIRDNDILGRYGGEEFGIIIPEVSYADVKTIAERIRKAVENFKFNIGTNYINVTISMGICLKEPQTDMNTMDIVRKADEALYEAKRTGRNKIIIYK